MMSPLPFRLLWWQSVRGFSSLFQHRNRLSCWEQKDLCHFAPCLCLSGSSFLVALKSEQIATNRDIFKHLASSIHKPSKWEGSGAVLELSEGGAVWYLLVITAWLAWSLALNTQARYTWLPPVVCVKRDWVLNPAYFWVPKLSIKMYHLVAAFDDFQIKTVTLSILIVFFVPFLGLLK